MAPAPDLMRAGQAAGLVAAGWTPLDGFAPADAEFWLAPAPALFVPVPRAQAFELQREMAQGRAAPPVPMVPERARFEA